MTEPRTRTETTRCVLGRPEHFHRVTLSNDQPLAVNEVRIQLEGCGVCTSDMAVWKGAPWFDYPLQPGSPGHEGWGHVQEIGESVTDFTIGDRVSGLMYHAYAQQDIVKAAELVKLPSELDGLPFPGEPLGCAMNIFQRSRIQPGMRVAIVGVGFLGVLLVNLCKAAGAEVIGISRRPYALEMARERGAEHTIRLRSDLEAVVDQVQQLTNNKGCDVVIEATGKAEPLALATQLTAIRGRLVIAGYHQDGPRQVDMQLWNWRGLDVINAHEREAARYISGIQSAVEAVRQGTLILNDLFTTFPLQEIDSAFRMAEQRPDGFLKALVIP